MVSLKEFSRKTKLPKADYTLEKLDELKRVLPSLTPRIEGRYSIIMVNIMTADALKIVEDIQIPEWIDVTMFLSAKRIEVVGLKHPEVLPKKETFDEQVNSVLTTLNIIIENKALRKLKSAYWNNISDFTDACHLLESKVQGTVTLTTLKKYVNYQKPVYASEVLNAFLLADRRRWSKFNTLLTELGDSYAYNALYKYAKTLLLEKNKYLQNQDTSLYVLSQVDGFTIGYVYSLFAMSTNYKQLQGIMHDIDARCAEALERTMYDYL